MRIYQTSSPLKTLIPLKNTSLLKKKLSMSLRFGETPSSPEPPEPSDMNVLFTLLSAPFKLLWASFKKKSIAEAVMDNVVANRPEYIYYQQLQHLAKASPGLENFLQKIVTEKTLPPRTCDLGYRGFLSHLASFIAVKEAMAKAYPLLKASQEVQENITRFKEGDPSSQAEAVADFTVQFLKEKSLNLYSDFMVHHEDKQKTHRFYLFNNGMPGLEAEFKGTWVHSPQYFLNQIDDILAKHPERVYRILYGVRHDNAPEMLAVAAHEAEVHVASMMMFPDEEIPTYLPNTTQLILKHLQKFESPKAYDAEARLNAMAFFARQAVNFRNEYYDKVLSHWEPKEPIPTPN